MKNIYEDADGQQNKKDLPGEESFFENDESVFEPPVKKAYPVFQQRKQPEQKNNSASQSPALQLTDEQISAILAQLLANTQAPAQPAQPAVVGKQPQTQVAADSNDPGKRILFQSDDFDEQAEKRTLPKIGTYNESFYEDEDSIFESDYNSAYPAKQVNFSVCEVEVKDKDLPNLPAPRIVTNKRFTTNPSAAAGLKAPKKEETFVEEVDLDESLNASAQKALKEKSKLSTGEIIRRVILSLSLAAIVIASGVLVREYVLHKQNQQLVSELSDMIITEAETTTEETTTKQKDKEEKTTKKKEKATTTTAVQTTVLTAEQQWAQIRAQYSNIIFPQNMQLKYAKLYATNQDFVGYLSADAVNINLPIVQTDNDETYLTKNFYGKSTKYGCPFVTHLNNIEELDKNTVIFGHHMNDGTVFGALDAYKTIDGFKKAPVITFNTLYNDYQWKVIAAFITNAYEEDDNGYVFQYYFTSLSTEESFAAFLNELAQRSLYNTGVDVLPSDKILTLSTCSHEFDNARFVVVARLVRTGESDSVAVENATVNDNPRYPQAYYTKKKLDNPYANASKWYVE